MKIDTNSPAFPCHTNPSPERLVNAPQGMTKREEFAKCIMAGLCADSTIQTNWAAIAKGAVAAADALISELNK